MRGEVINPVSEVDAVTSIASRVDPSIRGAIAASVISLFSPDVASAQVYDPQNFSAVEFGATVGQHSNILDAHFSASQSIWLLQNASYGSTNLHSHLHTEFSVAKNEQNELSIIPGLGAGAAIFDSKVTSVVAHVELSLAAVLDFSDFHLSPEITLADGEKEIAGSFGFRNVSFQVGYGNHRYHIPPQVLGLPPDITHVHPIGEEVPVFISADLRIQDLALFNAIDQIVFSYGTTRAVNSTRTYPQFVGDIFGIGITFGGADHDHSHH